MDSVLKIRDKKTGEWISIDAIRGDAGKSAYEQAVEGGYEGTEEEFCEMVAGFPTEKHTKRKDNPHGVTAEQAGALPTTGGTVTGNLSVYKAEYPQIFVGHNTTNRGVITYYNNAMHIGCTVNGQQATLALLSDGTFKLWMSDGKGYNFYSEHNKPTASDVSALPISGGTIVNDLGFGGGYGKVYADKNCASLSSYNTTGDDGNARKIYVVNGTHAPGLGTAVRLRTVINGVNTDYNIYGEHNKKTGTYNGNDKAEARNILTEGVGHVLVISSVLGLVFVTKEGGFTLVNGTPDTNGGNGVSYKFSSNYLKFENGTLTIATSGEPVNKSGVTYTYYVI